MWFRPEETNRPPAAFCIREATRNVEGREFVVVVASVDKWLMREATVLALLLMRLAIIDVVDCMAS